MINEERYREVLETIRNAHPGYMTIDELYIDPVSEFIDLILNGMTLDEAISKLKEEE